jgi:diguanylate cyclase (GGDEF)-like protein
VFLDKTPQRGQSYTIVITLLIIGAFVLAFRNFEMPQANAVGVIVFALFALFLEMIAVEIPYYGYASLGICVYFCCAIHPYLGWRVASAIALICLIARALFRNKQPFWFRLSDFSSTMAMIMGSLFVYDRVYLALGGTGKVVETELKNIINVPFVVALLAAVGTSFIIDFFVSTTAAGHLNEMFQKTWSALRGKIRLFNCMLYPLGVIIFLAYIQSPQAPIALLFVIPPLVGLNYALTFSVQEVQILNQEELETALKNAQNELLEFKSKNEQITNDLQKKVDELSIVYEMSKALGASINLDGTLEIIISMIRKLIVYQSCVIFLLEKGNLSPTKYITPYKELLALSPLLQLEETIVNLVVQNRKPLLVPDMQTVNEQRIFKDEKCIMCVPLIIKERIIGVIYVGTTRQGTYNEDHLNILSILGNSAAISIESAQLYEEKEQSLIVTKNFNEKLEKSVRQLSALNELGKSLGSSLKMDDTLNLIGEKMKMIIDYQSFIIFLINRDSTELEIKPQRVISPYANLFKDITFKKSEGVLGWVIDQKKPLLLEDTRESRLPNVVEYERAAIIVPMIVENDAIGAFYVGAAQPHYYDEEGLKLVSTVTYQTAMAVKNAELYDKMVSLAITDGVTGLYTHRYFQERISEACKEYERNLKPFALVMIDTDYFKQYNDTLGHPAGDAVLREIAALIKNYSRESDLVCRYGGDEFAVILKDSDKDNSVKTAERIRQAFQLRFHTYKVKITASMGVASFPDDATQKKDLVEAADAALYKSKKNGKNQVNYAPTLVSQGRTQSPPQLAVKRNAPPPPLSPRT